MRRTVLAILLVGSAATLAIAGAAQAQTSETTQLDLSYALNPSEGTVDAVLEVDDPGSLVELHLAFGDLEPLEAEPELEGEWSWENGRAIADLREDENPIARWTADGRIRVETLEGEGHTSYVGEEFTILRAGNMVPNVRYRFPQGESPTFRTHFTVDAPEGFEVAGPWTQTAGAFELDGAIPRGFLVVDDDLEEVSLGNSQEPYRILRVEGAEEDTQTEEILLAARGYLGGVYGEVAHQRLIVVGPSPMFRGGLASPDGVFLHADADESVVAHEMVHAYQGWEFSRAPSDATIWIAEGLAEVHGKLLEVAADVTTREDAQAYMDRKHETAREEHGVALSSVVYGSEHEQAAYTKGGVVITALDERIRNATTQEYSIGDVLRHINTVTAEQGRSAWGSDNFNNTDFRNAISNVTGFAFPTFFEAYVHGPDVPALGALFPGQTSVRIERVDPDPAVANRPFTVHVALKNLDTRSQTVTLPVLVDSEEKASIQATLEPGQAAATQAEVGGLERGEYTLSVENSSRSLEVRGPPLPNVTIDVWPPEATSEDNVTVGARVTNGGESAYRGPMLLLVDGRTVLEQDVPVEAGQTRTFSRTLAPLTSGDHRIEAIAENGTVLAERPFAVTAPDEPPPPEPSDGSSNGGDRQAPGPGAIVAVTATAAIARLARGRARN